VLTIALGRVPFQVFTAFLEGRFNGPVLGVSLDDLLWAHGHLCGKELFVTMRARTIMDIAPADFDEGCTDVVLVTGARDHLNVSGGPSLPCHREAWLLCGWRDHLFGREQCPAFDSWPPPCGWGARGRRLTQDGIPVELTDQGEVAAVLTAKPRGLTGAIARIAHADEMTLREPADEAGQQELSQRCRRFVARPMGLVPLRGAIPCSQSRKSPGPCRNRQLDEHGHDAPRMLPPLRPLAMSRPDAIALASLAKYLRTRTLSHRVIASQKDRISGDDIGT